MELAATFEGTTADRSERAAAVIGKLSGAELRYFTANPGAKSAVEAYVRGEGQYLAHEFMNAAWEPFYVVDVADAFSSIGLQQVGSATLATNHLPLVLDTKAAQAIAGLATLRQQQLAVDFAINQRFRRDVFVRPGPASSDRNHLHEAYIGCAMDIGDIGPTLRVPRGQVRFQEAFVGDVKTLMACGSHTVGEAVATLAAGGQEPSTVERNLLYLVAGGVLAPFAAAHSPDLTRITGVTRVVERALTDAVTRQRDRVILPSAVGGNGLQIDAAEARDLLEWCRGGAVASQAIEPRLARYARLGLVQ